MKTRKVADGVGVEANLFARIENKKTGEVEWRETHNLVVTDGLNFLRDSLFGLDGRSMDFVALGDDNTASSSGMDSLQGTESIRKDLDQTDVDTSSNGSITYQFKLATTEPSSQPVDIGEIGLFADQKGDSNDEMFSRAIFNSPFEKNADIEIRFFYTISFTNP